MNILSLFDGMGGAYQALKQAKIPTHNYFSSEIDKWAIGVTTYNHKIHSLGDINNIEFKSLPKIDLIIGGSPCVVGDTLVTTKNGYRSISEILIGDEVLSSDGNYHTVLDKYIKYSSDLMFIKAGCTEGVTCTSNHKFYTKLMTRKWDNKLKRYIRTFSNPEWIEAKDLTLQHYIGLPIETNPLIRPKFHLKQTIKQYYASFAESKINKLLTNEDFWYFVGRYLGDGWSFKYQRKNRKNSFQYQIKICCHVKEKDYLDQKLKHLFNMCWSKPDRNCIKANISDIALYEFLQIFGKYAHGKTIPEWVHSLDNILLKALISGYQESDGYVKKNKIIKISSVSNKLLYGISRIYAKIYNRPYSISKIKRPPICIIENRVVNQRDTYEFSVKLQNNKQDMNFVENNFIWTKISKITQLDHSENVYDLYVENSHNYVGNNTVVHNCQGISISKLNRQNLNDPRSALFFKFVEAIQILKPKYFILENVASMNKETRQTFSQYVGVEPIEIDSTLLTAQSRKRLYGCNFKVEQPQDKNIKLSDIIESGKADRQKAYCLDASYYKGPCSNPYHQSGRRQQILEGSAYRMLTPVECERLQGYLDNYSKYGKINNKITVISNTQRYKMLGNSFTVPVIAHILKHL